LIKLVNPLKTISRLDLGQYQLSKINNCGNIKIVTDVSVEEIKKDIIKTSIGDFYYKYLVGADGSSSIVRRHLGLETKINIGMYYNINKGVSRFSWHLNHRQLKAGYVWVFPHINYTNVGVYFDPNNVSSVKARAFLEEFLNLNKYDYSDSKFEAAPISYLYKGCVFENIFLVGDAAGLASKSTGEGISFALISGEEVAKKILNQKYQMIKLNKVLVLKSRQERLLKLFILLPFMQLMLFRAFAYLVGKKWFQIYYGN
ncbi:NAD(P)/FAD-dependent oxidoreductase, partial [Patescibacteria group bacterium]|nr:NAD(P)/FAD-dependent oxidoreductase [Patescibacteria group bacterium]